MVFVTCSFKITFRDDLLSLLHAVGKTFACPSNRRVEILECGVELGLEERVITPLNQYHQRVNVSAEVVRMCHLRGVPVREKPRAPVLLEPENHEDNHTDQHQQIEQSSVVRVHHIAFVVGHLYECAETDAEQQPIKDCFLKAERKVRLWWLKKNCQTEVGYAEEIAQ